MDIKRGRAIYSDQCSWCEYVFEPSELVWITEKFNSLCYCSKQCLLMDMTEAGEFNPLTETLQEV